MHVERLTKLAELMDIVAADEAKRKMFDLNTWITAEPDAEGNLCRTAACAVGWAATDPWFYAEGLRIQLRVHEDEADHWERDVSAQIDGVTPVEEIPDGFHIGQMSGVMFMPRTASTAIPGFRGVAMFFGLTNRTVDWLFVDNSYRDLDRKAGPADVAARIRELLEHGEFKDF